jgi:hypothetical protein
MPVAHQTTLSRPLVAAVGNRRARLAKDKGLMLTLQIRLRRHLMIIAVLAARTYAHEGHGGKEIGPYDLDTPRQVSPETAAHIGLKTTEVDFGTVEDVLPLSGTVRAAPDRHWTISPRTAGVQLPPEHRALLVAGFHLHPGRAAPLPLIAATKSGSCKATLRRRENAVPLNTALGAE